MTPLSQDHQDYLNARAVPLSFADIAGLHGVTGAEAAHHLGRKEPVNSDGLAIPYPGSDPPFCRIRFDDPEAAGARYLTPAGQKIPVYVPPPTTRAANEQVPSGLEGVLLVVEGPIKALAVMNAGVEAVGLGGTSTTLTEKHGSRRLNDSWKVVAVASRKVIVCFDAGRATNPNVARDEARLALALQTAGADVYVASLPEKQGGGDQGPDDFIATAGPMAFHNILLEAVPAEPVARVAHHTAKNHPAAELLDDMPFMVSLVEASAGKLALVRTALEAGKVGVGKRDFSNALKATKEKLARAAKRRGVASMPDDDYVVHEGCLARLTGGEGNEDISYLCNFQATIEEECVADYGGATERTLVLAGALADGTPLPRVTIEPRDLFRPSWAIDAWGCAATIAPDNGAFDHVRTAIQLRSKPTSKRVYPHTGWRNALDATGVESGLPIFLHAGGSVGAEGVSVRLEERLSNYSLPREPQDVIEAVRTSLRLLEVGPRWLAVTLLALVYRAPLQSLLRADIFPFLVAKTGSLKTSLTMVHTAHFGVGLAERPVASWADSTPSIEMTLYCLKDVLALVDDYKPRSTNPDDKMAVRAREIVSSIGNQEGRGRMRQGGTIRPERPPRSLVISTGEVLPAGDSTVARTLPLLIPKDAVDIRSLKRAQDDVEALPHAMCAYIEWLRPRHDEYSGYLKKRFEGLRAKFQRDGAHLRSPSALAHVMLGLETMLEFATDVKAISAHRASELVDDGLVQLARLRDESVEHARDSDPVRRFVAFLRDLLAQRRLLLSAYTSAPLGERHVDTVPGEYIGWLDQQYVYLLPDVTYRAVKLAMDAGEPLPLNDRSLWAQLRDAGLVEPSDRGDRPRTRKTLGGERLDVIVMKKSAIFPGDDGDNSGGGGGGDRGGGGFADSAGGRDGDDGPNADDTGAAGSDEASDNSDFGDSAAETDPNRTKHYADRTTPGRNRTSSRLGEADGGDTKVPNFTTDFSEPSDSIGTVGTVGNREKSREPISFGVYAGSSGSIQGDLTREVSRWRWFPAFQVGLGSGAAVGTGCGGNGLRGSRGA